MKLKASLTHAMGEEVEPGAGPLPQLDVDGPAELEGGDEEGEPALAVALAAVGEGRERQEGRAHEDELQGARQSHQVRGLWAGSLVTQHGTLLMHAISSTDEKTLRTNLRGSGAGQCQCQGHAYQILLRI